MENTIASTILSPKIKNPKKLLTAPANKAIQAGDILSIYVASTNAIAEPEIIVTKTATIPGFLTSYSMSPFVILKTSLRITCRQYSLPKAQQPHDKPGMFFLSGACVLLCISLYGLLKKASYILACDAI